MRLLTARVVVRDGAHGTRDVTYCDRVLECARLAKMVNHAPPLYLQNGKFLLRELATDFGSGGSVVIGGAWGTSEVMVLLYDGSNELVRHEGGSANRLLPALDILHVLREVFAIMDGEPLGADRHADRRHTGARNRRPLVGRHEYLRQHKSLTEELEMPVFMEGAKSVSVGGG